MAHETNDTSVSPRRPFLSPREFSRLSGLSLATVHRYLKKGHLPFHQPGGPRGRILIPADALEMAAPGRHTLSHSPIDPGHLSGPRPRWTRRDGRTPTKET